MLSCSQPQMLGIGRHSINWLENGWVGDLRHGVLGVCRRRGTPHTPPISCKQRFFAWICLLLEFSTAKFKVTKDTENNLRFMCPCQLGRGIHSCASQRLVLPCQCAILHQGADSPAQHSNCFLREQNFLLVLIANWRTLSWSVVYYQV